MRTELSRTVESPADRVWEVVTDLERSPEVIRAIERIEVLEGESSPIQVGTRWRETRTMFGKSATEEMVVTDIRPESSYTVEADGPGAHYISVISVAALDQERTTLTMSFAAEAKGFGSRILAATIGRLFAGATRKALRQDLDDIAAAAERA